MKLKTNNNIIFKMLTLYYRKLDAKIQKTHIMNFFKIKTTWTNAEFIIIKLCIASAYLFIGSYFHNSIQYYYVPLLVIFVVTVIWFVYLWLKKMKNE